jgi:hypothetical protein
MPISADVQLLITAALIIDAFIFGALWQFLTLSRRKKPRLKETIPIMT